MAVVRLFKPNYWSLMNYTVRLPHQDYGRWVRLGTKATYDLGSLRDRPARFSNGSFISLDENALVEEAGLSGGQCQNTDCSSYSDPVVFEGIFNPNDPGSQMYPNWIDLTVSWLDWNLDGQRSNTPVVENVNLSCQINQAGLWENEATGETGQTKAVCREVLTSSNDIDFLENGEWQQFGLWTRAENLTAQRAALGLEDPSQISITLPPDYELTSADEISCP